MILQNMESSLESHLMVVPKKPKMPDPKTPPFPIDLVPPFAIGYDDVIDVIGYGYGYGYGYILYETKKIKNQSKYDKLILNKM